MLENLIRFFAPSWAASRERARASLELLKGQRQYDAASYSPRLRNWNARPTSANQELGVALVTLRNRSRDLCRNNPWAKRAVQAIANNTVGSGMMPSILDVSEATEQAIKKAFFAWAAQCEFDNGHSLWFVQKQAMRAVVESGECLILKKIDLKAPLGFKIQILESDYLDHNRDTAQTSTGGYIRYGIEFDAEGRRKGYWLFKSHPGDNFSLNGFDSVFVPASDVIHVYEATRPGQVRGIPFGASAMVRLRDLDAYEDAQLLRQKIAACFSVFIERPPVIDSVTAGNVESDFIENIDAGAVYYNAPGETVTFSNPPNPGGMEEYTRNVKSGIAAGFGITYEALTGDYSRVNYSSARMAKLEMFKNIADWQEHIIIPMLNTLWVWFSDMAILSGKLTTTYECEWSVPRVEMMDPQKETAATKEALAAGLISYPEALRRLGYDPDDVMREMEASNKKLEAKKLSFNWKNNTQPNGNTDTTAGA